MFQSLSGFKAQYHYLTLLVVPEFNEWKILLHGPDATIHVPRQFNEAKAKENALAAARNYIHDEKHSDLPAIPEVEWAPTAPGEWLLWRG